MNCFTEKVCITADKGGFLGIGGKDNSCKQFAGEGNVRTVEVKLAEREKTLETIQREVANSMFDCWMMTGQGKMDIFEKYSSSDIVGKVAEASLSYAKLNLQDIKTQCIVCSRVAFSDALIDADKDRILSDIDYNDFMSREKVPGSSLTYFKAFTDEGVGAGYGAIKGNEEKLSKYYGQSSFSQSEVGEIKIILNEQLGTSITEDDKNSIDLLSQDDLIKYFAEPSKSKGRQIAIVFAQIKVPSLVPEDQYWNSLRNGAIIGGLGLVGRPGKIVSLLIPGAGWFKALTLVAGVGVTSLNLAFGAEETVRKNQALSAATCGTFESKIEGEQKGCSLVKLVNWDIDTINNLCTGGIEGNL